MNLAVDDKQTSYVLDGLECLMEHWREFNYDVTDVLTMSLMHKAIKEYVNKRIKEMDSEPDLPETLKREPNKGERQIYGKESYVKSTTS